MPSRWQGLGLTAMSFLQLDCQSCYPPATDATPFDGFGDFGCLTEAGELDDGYLCVFGFAKGFGANGTLLIP